MADRVGQQLGNYQLIRLLGEGGFAEVYLGEHIHLGTQAAIKVLHTQLTSDDVDKFHNEAHTIAHLIHPHIVRVLEFGIEDKTPFLVMDYAPHGTLRQRYPKGTRLPLDIIVSYVKQLANALQYAHDEKVIHRDIKPENMLLGRRNEILLSDFGIALITQSSHYQSVQEIAGTMAYMAPEQIQGKPRPASDQYSLGIVVYEWLSGDRPFHGSLTELVGQHLSVPPPSLQEKVPMISPEVDQVVLMTLAKDPKHRFASVQAFAIALQEVSQPVLHHPTISSIIAQPLSQLPQSSVEASSLSQPLLPNDAVAAMPIDQSSLAMGVATPSKQPLEPTDTTNSQNQTPQSIEAITTSSVSPFPPAGGPVRYDGLQLSLPPQHRISRRTVLLGLTGLTVAGGSLTWLVLSQKSQVSSPNNSTPPTSSASSPAATSAPLGTRFLIYRGHSGSVQSVAWSPDSMRIASGSLDKTVQIWDASSGDQIYTYRGHTDPVQSVAWSPDGTRIASSGDDKTVQIWDATTGNLILTYRGHFYNQYGWIPTVAWSPNGTHIASGSQDKTIQVFDATTGSTTFIYRGHSGYVFTVAWSPDGTLIASGGDDKTVQVWNAATGGHVYTYHGHSGTVWKLAWSPDGTRIVSGSDDKSVQIWDATTGNLILTYRGHSNFVFTVAWSPDGKHIASGGYDATMQIWDATNGDNIYTYRNQSNAVSTPDAVASVAWPREGTRIAFGSYDATAQVLQAS